MRRLAGFTLIELLVVLAIMGTAISIVGPLSYQQYKAAEARAEWQKVILLVELARQRAFLTGQHYRVTLQGKQVTVYEQQVEKFKLLTDQVFFTGSELQINANGFSDKPVFRARVRNVEQEYRFSQWRQ